MLAAKRQKVC